MSDHHINSADVFTRKAQAYNNGRPYYPAAFMEKVARAAYIISDDAIMDAGSGTGKSSEHFVRMGCTVYGVEPNDAMLAESRLQYAGKHNFIGIHGSAAEPNLPPGVMVDFILAAQAMHWWAPQKDEVKRAWRRILKPDGKLIVLTYNPPRENLLAQDIHRFMGNEWPSYIDSPLTLIDAPMLDAYSVSLPYLDKSAGRIHRRVGIPMVVLEKNKSDFLDLIFSYSFAPDPKKDEAKALRPGLEAIFNHHQSNGIVKIPYFAQMVIGSLAQD